MNTLTCCYCVLEEKRKTGGKTDKFAVLRALPITFGDVSRLGCSEFSSWVLFGHSKLATFSVSLLSLSCCFPPLHFCSVFPSCVLRLWCPFPLYTLLFNTGKDKIHIPQTYQVPPPKIKKIR